MINNHEGRKQSLKKKAFHLQSETLYNIVCEVRKLLHSVSSTHLSWSALFLSVYTNIFNIFNVLEVYVLHRELYLDCMSQLIALMAEMVFLALLE